jgi:hypothetical protein
MLVALVAGEAPIRISEYAKLLDGGIPLPERVNQPNNDVDFLNKSQKQLNYT